MPRGAQTLNPDSSGAGLLSVPFKTPSESGSEALMASSDLSSPLHHFHRVGTSSTKDPDASSSENLGNSIFYDDPDSYSPHVHGTPDPVVTQKAIDQIQAKLEKTKELIKEEQKARDENVNEYLKLSSSADKQQQIRIKQVFEKKNQKSAQNVAHYQKKMEEYMKKMQELQEYGIRPPRHSRKLGQGLRNVGGNIRDGISEMSSTVMSKPKEFAHKLKHKFGSADNLTNLGKDSDSEKNNSHTGSASLPRDNSGLSGSGNTGRKSSIESQKKRKCISDDGRDLDHSHSQSVTGSSPSEIMEDSHAEQAVVGQIVTPEVISQTNKGSSPKRQLIVSPANETKEDDDGQLQMEWKAVNQELILHKEEVEHIREEIDNLRQHFKQEVEALHDQLREEKDRCERLEEQLNDLTELHQHEIEDIKAVVNDMEEKVQYQSEERLTDIKEHLQSLETKVTSMEHQQAQQQYLHIEGLDSTDARALMMKLLTAAITVVHIILFVMGTIMGLARPFLSTTGRGVTTLTIAGIATLCYYKQEELMAIVIKLTLRPDSSST